MHAEVLLLSLYLCCVSLYHTQAKCFTSKSGVAMTGYVIKSYTSNFLDCYNECKSNPVCRSINYFIQKSLCHHNSRKISDKPENKILAVGCSYIDNPLATGKYFMSDAPNTCQWTFIYLFIFIFNSFTV